MPKIEKQTFRKAAKGDVVSRIAPVTLGDAGLKMNVYGRSGTGKTTFACTFPKPLLIIGAEDGTRSVHNVKGVRFVQVRSSAEVVTLVGHLREHAAEWKTVVLDSASSLQDLILKELLGLDQLPTQKSWGLATRDQWGQCSIQTKELLRELLDLSGVGVHVVVTAQEREFNTENESELLMPFVGSAMTPSTTGWLNPACDYIVQAFIRERMEEKIVKVGDKRIPRRVKTGGVDYCIRTAPDPVYTTKFRVPKGTRLPEVLVDPDYDKVMALVRGGA